MQENNSYIYVYSDYDKYGMYSTKISYSYNLFNLKRYKGNIYILAHVYDAHNIKKMILENPELYEHRIIEQVENGRAREIFNETVVEPLKNYFNKLQIINNTINVYYSISTINNLLDNAKANVGVKRQRNREYIETPSSTKSETTVVKKVDNIEETNMVTQIKHLIVKYNENLHFELGANDSIIITNCTNKTINISL